MYSVMCVQSTKFSGLKKKVHNFQRIYKIMFIQHTNYLNSIQNFQTLYRIYQKLFTILYI